MELLCCPAQPSLWSALGWWASSKGIPQVGSITAGTVLCRLTDASAQPFRCVKLSSLCKQEIWGLERLLHQGRLAITQPQRQAGAKAPTQGCLLSCISSETATGGRQVSVCCNQANRSNLLEHAGPRAPWLALFPGCLGP